MKTLDNSLRSLSGFNGHKERLKFHLKGGSNSNSCPNVFDNEDGARRLNNGLYKTPKRASNENKRLFESSRFHYTSSQSEKNNCPVEDILKISYKEETSDVETMVLV
jgi:hypothetical protein